MSRYSTCVTPDNPIGTLNCPQSHAIMPSACYFGVLLRFGFCSGSNIPRMASKTCMGLLPDTQNCGLRMRRECRERFPRHRALAIPTCFTTRAGRSRHSRRMRNPQFCVSGKRPIENKNNMIAVFFPGFNRCIPVFDWFIPAVDRFSPAFDKLILTRIPVTATLPYKQKQI